MTASPLISPVCAFVAAIVTGAAGVGRVVPPNVLRQDVLRDGFDDPGYPAINEERTVAVRYLGDDGLSPDSPFCGCRRKTLHLEVVIAYRYDTETASVGDANPGASKGEAERLRAADDKAVVELALDWPANFGTATNGAVIVNLTPGAHRFDDTGVAILSTFPVTVLMEYDPRTAWAMGTAAA